MFKTLMARSMFNRLVHLNTINPSPTKKTSIVFIHGWGILNFAYFRLKKYFEQKGYLVFMTDFDLMFNDIDSYTRKLDEFIKSRNIKNIVFVGSSLGGIVALNYVRKNGWKNVDKVITIASPLHGTWVALLGYFSRSARQMLPNSTFMRRFNVDTIKNKSKIFTLSARFDEVVGKSSSRIDGAKNANLKTSGHQLIQVSKETLNTIEHIIKNE